MSGRYACDGAEGRIEALALAVSGLTEPPEAGAALLEAAVCAALGLCGRGDVPRAMEPALGIMLAELYREGLHQPVSSVKRGDTAITYTAGERGMGDYRQLLAPFVRLRTV